MTRMQDSEQLAELKAIIEEAKAAAERAKHDFADSLARVAEAERLLSEIEAVRKNCPDGATIRH